MRASLLGFDGAVVATPQDLVPGPMTYRITTGASVLAVRVGDFVVTPDGEVIACPFVVPLERPQTLLSGELIITIHRSIP